MKNHEDIIKEIKMLISSIPEGLDGIFFIVSKLSSLPELNQLILKIVELFGDTLSKSILVVFTFSDFDIDHMGTDIFKD